jgi:hypothetical protein
MTYRRKVAVWREAHLAPTTPRNADFDSMNTPTEVSSLFEIAKNKQSIHVRKCHTGNEITAEILARHGSPEGPKRTSASV